ncbi:MAG TPA: hypothetical protein VIL28_11095 [Steroidobacteraceae bacterium]
MNIHPTAICALVACLLCSTAFAQERAVRQAHFELDISSVELDTSDSTSSGAIGADFAATLPLGRFFGLSLGGGYERSRVRTREVLEDESGQLAGTRPSCTFDSIVGTATLFARVPSFGRLSVGYDIGDLSTDCDGVALFPTSGKDDQSTDGYRYALEAYLGNFTLGASHIVTQLENGPELETTTVSASWYPLDSLKVELFGNDLYEDDTYGLRLEHQPEIFGDGLGVHLSFAKTDASPSTRTWELGIAYYFGRRVALKTRDREYR